MLIHFLIARVRRIRGMGRHLAATSSVFLLSVFAAPAYAAGSNMPWEQPLNQILESIQGPVAKVMSIAFAASSFVWCDEEPPEEHYFEALARCAATQGLIYSTFTPLSGFNRILPRFYREEDPKAAARRCVVRMALEDADHFKDPAKREALLGNYPAHQRRTRAEGRPMMGSGAVFEPVDADNLAEDIYLLDGEITNATGAPQFFRAWALLWAIDFGIDHPFAAVLLGWDRDRDCIHVLAELKIRGGIPPAHASAMKRIAPNVLVAWPHDGNQRDKGSGKTLASIYKGEGLKMLATHSTFSTGGYSTEAGIMDMLARMKSGRFKVSDHCREWRDEFQTYHRKEGLIVKVNDDLMSATRVGVMQIRSAKVVALDPAYRGWAGGDSKRGSGQIAQGVDFDVFDPHGGGGRMAQGVDFDPFDV